MFAPFTTESFLNRVIEIGQHWSEGTIWGLAHKPKYTVHTIQKKVTGKNILLDDTPDAGVVAPKLRVIHEPSPALKMAQWFILNQILTPAAVSLLPCAHGCVPGRSTLTNAEPHVGASWKAHMDVKDFFPTITAPRVYGLFAKRAGYEPKLAWLLSRLCTFEGKLPQGAPTSPMIANLIATPMDREIMNLMGRMGGYYTRYVDDLTVSFRRRISRDAQAMLLETIGKIVVRHGFTVNQDKTSAHSRKNRMIVTGVVVNDVASVPRSFRKNLRAAAHQERLGVPGADLESSILGRLSYIQMINPAQAEAVRRSCRLA